MRTFCNVLSFAIIFQCFEPVTGGEAKSLNSSASSMHLKFALRDGFNVLEPLRLPVFVKRFCIGAKE
jgi:hypothetical protein